MKKLSAFIAIGLVCLVGISYAFLQQTEKEPKEPEKTTSNISQSLEELNQTFKYKGKYINPRAIQDLTAWVSDREPGSVAVDVEGTFDSNRYYGHYENQDGLIFIDLTQESIEDLGSFSYRYLGRLANGLHVLRTFYHAGGSGIFQEILLLEGLIDFEYDADGKHNEKLILKRRGSYGLGDRYAGKIKIDAKENKITIGTDERNELKEEYIIQIK